MRYNFVPNLKPLHQKQVKHWAHWSLNDCIKLRGERWVCSGGELFIVDKNRLQLVNNGSDNAIYKIIDWKSLGVQAYLYNTHTRSSLLQVWSSFLNPNTRAENFTQRYALSEQTYFVSHDFEKLSILLLNFCIIMIWQTNDHKWIFCT